MWINKKKCTEITVGTITRLKSQGLDNPTLIYVDYQVDGKVYTLKDTIKLKAEIIKLGFLPIGQKDIPVMGDTRVGSPARVSYNPDEPSKAYLTDNIGIRNA